MTVTARKYNPGFLTDDELVASFRVRTDEFESMIESLRECTGSANTHQIVIGPRGSGKTSLLLRVAAEIRRDERLSARFFPIVFAEESYEVSTAGEFWLEALFRLAEQAPGREDDPNLHRGFEELRQIQDDRTLGDRCLGVLQDFADRTDKRLVLIVENLNTMLAGIDDDDARSRLRHTLQTEPRVLLLASATSRFEEIDNPDRPLYDLFRVLTLRPLDKEGCATLWQTVTGQRRTPDEVQPLKILTGGSPRLLTIVARFGANLSFRELMADLLDLVDDHTVYFKSHLEALPAQERRVYLALADLWKPATAREIADRSRLQTSQCSAQLKRLTGRGVVEAMGGTERRKLYYIVERLYNIYYLMRRARQPAPMVDALIRFMEAYYPPDELKDRVAAMAQEASGLEGEAFGIYWTAFEQLVRLPSLEAHRQELLSLASATFDGRRDGLSAASPPSSIAEELLGKARAFEKAGRLEDAVGAWDEVLQRFGAKDSEVFRQAVALALQCKGTALLKSKRFDESLTTWNELLRRYAVAKDETLVGGMAMALVGKGVVLMALGRLDGALAVWDEVLPHLGTGDRFPGPEFLALAMNYKGIALARSERLDEAVSTWSQVVERFGGTETSQFVVYVAQALEHKAVALVRLDRLEAALAMTDEAVQRFGLCDAKNILEVVADTLVNRGWELLTLDRAEEAQEIWADAQRRFEGNDSPKMWNVMKSALLGRATVELARGQNDAAIAAADRVFRHGGTGSPEIGWLTHRVRARAHIRKGDTGACASDVEAILTIMPDLGSMSKDVLDWLSSMAVALGLEKMRDLIKASPSSDLLLPLTTALEIELGEEPRVAKEVEEVAEDILRDLEELRKEKLSEGGAAALDPGSRPG